MAVHTIKGVKLNLDPQQFDDMELLEQLGEIQDGNPLVFPKVMLRLAGGSKKKRDEIYDALRDKDGRVSVEAASEFFMKAMQAAAPKSPSSQD